MTDKNNTSGLDKLTKHPLSIDEIHTLANNLELVELERESSRNRKFSTSIVVGISMAILIGVAALTKNPFIGIGAGVVSTIVFALIFQNKERKS